MALDPIKISDYDELAAEPAAGDLFVIVDISEAADIDKTKHIKYSNLVPTRHTVGVPVTSPLQLVTTGDGKAYLPIPTDYDGMNLVDAQASVSDPASAAIVTVQIHNLTGAADMLTTRITIDATEYTSYTAANASVIDAANDDVSEGDMLRFDVDVDGDDAKGLTILCSFEKP